MTRGGLEGVWAPREDLSQEMEETEDEIAAWMEIGSAGRATLSLQGFHHFLKPEIFRGDPTLDLCFNEIVFLPILRIGQWGE